MEKEKDQCKPQSNGISYQNKDISSKFVAENYGNTLFEVCGLNIPRLVRSEATELPDIEVSSMFMDRLFFLEDGSYAIIDFESSYKESNKVKYLGYLARLVKRLYNQDGRFPDIHIVIIYTADVKPGSTNSVIDLGENRIHLTESFLVGWDSDAIFESIERKLENKGELSNKEKIQLMLLPLSVVGKIDKKIMIQKVIGLIKRINNSDVMMQVAAGILAFSDKIIDINDSEEVRRLLMMTKVGRLIYEDQLKAVSEGIRNDEIRIARNLLAAGDSMEKTASATGLELSLVEELAKEIQGEAVSV